MAKVTIYLEGYPAEREEELVQRLVQASPHGEEVIRTLVRRGRVRIVEGIEEADAERVRAFLEPVGARIAVEPGTPPDADLTLAEPPPVPPVSPPPASIPPSAGDGEVFSISPSAPSPEPRPLGFQRRLSWGLELFRRNLKSLLGLLLVGILAGILAGMLMPLIGMLGGGIPMAGAMLDPAAMANPLQMMAMLFSPAAMVTLVLSMLVMFLVVFWLQAATYRLPADSLASGERAPLKQTLKRAFARTPDFVTAMGVVMLVPLPIQMVAALAGSLLGPLVGMIVGLAALVAIVWLSLSLLLTGPVVVLEGIGPFAAMARGWRLAQGMRWRMLGNLLLYGLLALVAMVASMLPLWLAGVVGGIVGMVLSLLGGLVLLVVSLLIGFVGMFIIEAFYFEARVVKEGWLPGWMEVPHESWRLAEGPEEPAAGRGARAWLEMVGVTVVALLLLVAAGMVMPTPEPSLSIGSEMEFGRVHEGMSEAMPGGAPVEAAAGDGQMVLAIDHFWEDDSDPHVWLSVATGGIAGLPAGAEPGGLLTIEVERVTGRGGNDVYHRDSQMEEPFFHKVRFNHRNDGTLSGIRDIRVVAGTAEGDVSEISGLAHLAIPQGIESVTLTTADVGSEHQAAGLRVRLAKFSGEEVTLEIEGSGAEERFIDVLGDADGEQVSTMWSSTSSGGGQLTFAAGFAKPVTSARVIVAAGIVRQSQPFTVAQGESRVIELE